VRQWVLSMPKRLRYYLQRDKGALNAALRIFLRVVQQSLQTHCPSAAKADPISLHLGAVAFIHRFGSSLNTHVHFHVCVVDGVFEAVAGPIAQPVDAAAQANPEPAPQSVIFHAATGLDEAAFRSCANASCAPLWLAATSRHVTPKTWQTTPTAAVSQSMPGCASRHLTALGWSDCCVTVHVRHSLWTGSSSAALI